MVYTVSYKLETMGIFDYFKPKYRHSDHEMRLEGLEKLEDDAILLDMALNDVEKKVRLAAFEKISHPGYFPLIAVRSHDEDIRKEAFNRINDCEDFAQVAKLSHDEHTQKKAIHEINTIHILENLKQDMDHSMHPEIEKRIEKISRER